MAEKSKQELIREIEALHKEQRGFQRLVYGEELDYEKLKGMSVEELEEAIAQIKAE